MIKIASRFLGDPVVVAVSFVGSFLDTRYLCEKVESAAQRSHSHRTQRTSEPAIMRSHSQDERAGDHEEPLTHDAEDGRAGDHEEPLTQDAEDERAGDHEDGLDGVCPDDGRQPAEDGEQGGDQQQHDDGQVQAQVALPLHGPLNEQRPGVQVRLGRQATTDRTVTP